MKLTPAQEFDLQVSQLVMNLHTCCYDVLPIGHPRIRWSDARPETMAALKRLVAALDHLDKVTSRFLPDIDSGQPDTENRIDDGDASEVADWIASF